MYTFTRVAAIEMLCVFLESWRTLDRKLWLSLSEKPNTPDVILLDIT